MAAIVAVPSLEELSLVDVCGQQCMPGVETNLAELLLTAAEATPDRVCLEVEEESFTFAQAGCSSLKASKIAFVLLHTLSMAKAGMHTVKHNLLTPTIVQREHGIIKIQDS